ncbi:MAG TPA: HD domain-containing phosphohydrolase [Burkholderiales bacterium]|jgi:HD-GYP domain-containing protein (c-di-GMP phosphodiesterase class II)|nr:HD domain-containing phosphohydrolase [Burkholderiales bacterium]
MKTLGPPRARSYPLYIHLAVLFSVLVLLTGGLIAWLGYGQGRDLTLAATENVFDHIGRETHSSLSEAFEPLSRFVDVLALLPLIDANTLDERLRALPVLRQAFSHDSPVAAIYTAYTDGGFFLFRPLTSETARTFFAAPAEAKYLVLSIEPHSAARPRPLYIYFDEQLRELQRRDLGDYEYDPRTRPWYLLAQTPGQTVFTEAYVFFSTGSPGVTIGKRANERSVVGLDITLAHISSKLAELATLPGMRIALFDEQRRLVARSDVAHSVVRRDGDRLSLSTLDDSGDPLLAALHIPQGKNKAIDLRIDGREWKNIVLPVDTALGPLYLAIAVPMDELLKDLRAMRTRNVLISIALLLCAVPLTALAAHTVARSLRRVTAQAKEIRAFKFDGANARRSVVLEVDELAQAMQMMRNTIRNFLEVATSLNAETNLDRLLQRVVKETCNSLNAIGGLVYLRDADDHHLRPAALVTRDGEALNVSAAPISIDVASPIAAAFRTCATQVAPLSTHNQSHLAVFQSLWPQHNLTIVAIPLRERTGDQSGVVALFTTDTQAPSPERLAFAESLSRTAAVAIETSRLLESRKELLDAFIRLVAGAIDSKSPYTGGHCQRVPELTFMLARAACNVKTGPFKDFTLDEQQWEALQIAGWLHDCGKVTTPEYVVDKATKLETIYDRLHEIRMRFEVIKRDVQIEFLRRSAAGGDIAKLEADRDRLLAELDAEFAFVASCNEGGEFMRPESVEKLERIAQRTWQRTLDDTIGLSYDEKKRKARTPAKSLPATETLIADKPEHLLERPANEELAANNPWGFKIPATQYKYNRGELHNLRIARGTLNDEERYIINHHIVQTIIMLSQLPFPPHLRDIPDIAGGHHEKIDGTGYPRRLNREEMLETSRMMAIADIFEALTASDRPYKHAKTLSESLKILQKMKQEQHVDPDLYELFIDSGVWREYAERFLQPEQIDVDDASPYR